MSWRLDPVHTQIAFAAQHMGITFVTGRFTRFAGQITLDEESPERSAVVATIDAASVTTDNWERDAHLRSPDFFDVTRWPTVLYRSDAVMPLGFDTYHVAGHLTIRGVTHPVDLEAVFGGVTVDAEGYRRAGFSARGYLNRADYGLTWNAPLEQGGMTIGQKVRLEIEAELVESEGGAGVSVTADQSEPTAGA